MKKIVFAVLLLAVLLFPVSGINLFIVTDPMGAGIILDKTPLPRKTPCLLKDIEPGEHEISLHMEDRITERIDIEISTEEETVIITKKLSGPFFNTIFRYENDILLNGKDIKSADQVLTLPLGTYEIRNEGNLTVEELFPGNSLLKGLSIAFFTSLLYSGGLAVEKALEYEEDFTITPLMLTSWGATALLGIGEIKLLIDRSLFRKRRREVVPKPDLPSPGSIYEEAEGYMSRGDLETAFGKYSALITDHPSSTYMPFALYKLSKINIVIGNTSLAAAGLEELFHSYPLPELYDKVCHSLAGLYARENDLNRSGEFLDAMIFHDPLFTREEIEDYRRELNSRDYGDDAVPEAAGNPEEEAAE